MINPAAIGVAILILLAVTTTVESSSAYRDYRFEGSQQSLSKILTSKRLKDAMGSYQRQTNVIDLHHTALESPHWLQIEVPTGMKPQGHISINDEVHLPLEDDLLPIDLSPYLKAGHTRITLTGTYVPASASALVRFTGPDTLVQQQTGSDGQLNYQLNLIVE
jgi:hypothetical protein